VIADLLGGLATSYRCTISLMLTNCATAGRAPTHPFGHTVGTTTIQPPLVEPDQIADHVADVILGYGVIWWVDSMLTNMPYPDDWLINVVPD
jgi:hypothetical protein